MSKQADAKTLSRPLLLPELIKSTLFNPVMKGARSMIFSEDAHRTRLRMCNWTESSTPDILVYFDSPASGFSEHAKRTQVHLYAIVGDILSLFEALRYGASADQKDSGGITPLYATVTEMLLFFHPGIPIVRTDTGKIAPPGEKNQMLARLLWAVRILLEQHVDVNVIVKGVSLLDLACSMLNWELIALLLEHGVQITAVEEERYIQEFIPENQVRFYALVKSKQNAVRPPRVCPCWSGKTLSDCHATKQPYPLKFLCICGSGKAYEKCCLQKRPVSEKWGQAYGRIVHCFDAALVGEMVPPMDSPTKILQDHCALAATLLETNEIDPAFAYALERTTYKPMPSHRLFSRIIQEKLQQRWNDLVDEYIKKRTDSRSTFEIEKNAKIGLFGGALIRTCEGEGCAIVEKRDMDALKKCSKCHIAVYCSPVCQRSAWPKHKSICGTSGQRPQLLASQDAFISVMIARELPAFVSKLQGLQI